MSERTAKQKARQQRLRRARLALTNGLGWTRGVPVDGGRRWLILDGTVPEGSGLPRPDSSGVIEPNQELVAASYRTVINLTGRHRQFLAEVVDDPELWELGVRALLGHMQALVHDGVPLPADISGDLGIGIHTRKLVDRLVADAGLAPFVRLAGWMHVWQPRHLRKTLAAIEANRDALAAHTNGHIQLRHDLLTILARTPRARFPDYLGLLLAHPSTPGPQQPVRLGQKLALALRHICNGKKFDSSVLDPSPPGDLPELTATYLRGLSSSSDREFSHQVRLGEAALGRALAVRSREANSGLANSGLANDGVANDHVAADDVSDKVAAHNRLLAAIDEATAAVRFAAREIRFGGAAAITTNTAWVKEARELASEIESLVDDHQAMPRVEAVVKMLQQASELAPAEFNRLLRLIEAAASVSDPGAAGSWPIEVRLLDRWLEMRLYPDVVDEPAVSKAWLAALNQGVTGWTDRMSRSHYFANERALLLVDAPQRVTALRAVSLACPDAKPRFILSLFGRGARSIGEVVAAADRFAARDTDASLEAPATLIALFIHSATPDLFVDAWDLLEELLWDRDHIRKHFGTILDWLAREWGLGLYELLELKQEFGPATTLEPAALLCELGRDLPLPPPSQAMSSDSDYDWCERYPPRFHAALEGIQRLGGRERAVSAAEAVLAKSFPDPEAVAQQVAAIDEQIAAGGPAHLAQRRAALVDRTAPDAKLSAKLSRRLARRVQSARLQAAQRALSDVLAESLHPALGLSADTGPTLAEADSRIAAAILALKEPYRSLGLAVCRGHFGGEPFDVVAHESNRRFLDRMTAAGLDTEPWLTAEVERVLTAASPPITVRIERDPFVALSMGQPFGTCLSPGDFNFWSAVVNAVDINKLVIVGRDHEGRMVCRCLIALNESFEILGYHAYAHDPEWGFLDVVREMVSTLADLTGARVGIGGDVTPVVASDWYDDGPRDLLGRLDFMRHDSEFMIRVRNGKVDCDEIIERIDRSEVDVAVIINRVLNIYSRAKYLELERAVVALARIDLQLGFWEWQQLAALAARHGRPALAEEIMRKHVLARVQRGRHDLDVDLLGAIDPSLVLRLLRQTRGKGVRSDLDETDDLRLEALADAHSRLGRDVRAAQLRERMSTKVAEGA